MVRFDYSKHKPTYSLNDFEFLHDPKDKNSKLGTGSFATVKLAKDKSGKLYALKMIDTGHSRFSKTDLENLKLEIDIHKCLDHPNIIKFHGYIQDNNVIYLVLDYAENGNLYTYLHRKKILTEKEIFRFFHQTCLAIHHLHQNNIVHRDIKPENLLLDKDFNIKICDFGWSAYDIRRERETFCGTYEYMAPEIVQKKPYDYRVDIWAVGILLYELIHNKAPYKGRSLHEIKNSLNKGEISFNPNISQNAKELIQSILKDKPSKRISMIQILTDRWVNDHLEMEESFRRSVYLESINFLAHQNETENESEKNTEESQSNPLSFFAKAIQQMFKSEEPVLRKAESNILPQIEDLPTTNNFILHKSKSTNEKLMKAKSSPNKSARTPKKTKKIFEGVTLTPRFQNRLNQIIKNIRSKRNSEISPRQEDSSASTSNSTLEVNIVPKTATALEKSSQSPLLQVEPQITNLLVENSLQPKEMTSKPILIEKSIKISLKNISNFGNVVKDMKQEEDKFKAPSSALLERNKNSGQENSRKRIFDRADYLKNIKLEVHKTVSNKLTDLHSANEVRSSSWFNGKNNKENVSGLSIGARNI